MLRAYLLFLLFLILCPLWAVSPLATALARLQSNDYLTSTNAADALVMIGTSAVPSLITLLKNPASSARRETVQALAAIGRPALPALLTARSHPNTAVREGIIQALAQIDDPRSVDGLIAALNDTDWRNRWQAAEGLAKLGDVRATPALIKRLTDEQRVVRMHAVWALASLRDPRAVAPLITLLKRDDIDHIQVPDALARIGSVAVVDSLLKAMGAPEYRIRAGAARALGKLGDDRALPLLRAAMQRRDGARAAAIEALGSMHDAESLPSLLALLRDDEVDDTECSAAINALRELDDRRAVQPLLTITTNADATPSLRTQALLAAVYLGDPAVTPVVLAALQERDTWLRQSAIYAAGLLREPHSVEPLLALLRQQRDAREIITALGEIGDARAVDQLLTYVSSNTPSFYSIGTEAINSLMKIGVPVYPRILERLQAMEPADKRFIAWQLSRCSAVELLQGLATDLDPRIRRAALQELIWKKTDPTILLPLLRKARRDADLSVRVMALETLAAHDEPGVREELLKMADDPATREYAIPVLGRLREPRAIPIIRATLRVQALSMRLVTVTALGEMRDAGAIPALLPLLKDKDVGLRIATVTALGVFDDEPGFRALLAALGDHAPAVRRAAAAALGQRQAIDATTALVAVLHDDNVTVQAEAATALGRIGLKYHDTPVITAAVAPLVTLATCPRTYTQSAAIAALGMIGDPRAIETLTALLAAPEHRATVMTALHQMGEAGETQIITAMQNPNRDIRAAAAGVWNADGQWMVISRPVSISETSTPVAPTPRVIQPLLAAMTDRDATVRTAAMWSVAKLADTPLCPQLDPAVEPLIAALSSHATVVAAEEALGALKDPRAFAPLAALLQSDDVWTRRQVDMVSVAMAAVPKVFGRSPRAIAAIALGRLGDVRALPLLRTAMQDRDPEVRAAATGALALLNEALAQRQSRSTIRFPILLCLPVAGCVYRFHRRRSRLSPPSPSSL